MTIHHMLSGVNDAVRADFFVRFTKILDVEDPPPIDVALVVAGHGAGLATREWMDNVIADRTIRTWPLSRLFDNSDLQIWEARGDVLEGLRRLVTRGHHRD